MYCDKQTKSRHSRAVAKAEEKEVVLIIAAVLFPLFLFYALAIPTIILRLALAALFLIFRFANLFDGKLARFFTSTVICHAQLHEILNCFVSVAVLFALVARGQIYFLWPAYLLTIQMVVLHVGQAENSSDNLQFAVRLQRVVSYVQAVWITTVILVVPVVWWSYVQMVLLGAVLSGASMVLYHVAMPLVMSMSAKKEDNNDQFDE